ncbi:DUF3631 domain-containing protein [Bifidobacterium amazonense]|uniref:DUF3631 domain-containing protein n=1 Tax=Bifidobacterium amazonense TaxID=2809027 RepID=A0ABS9VWW2_9BIFI|nr:DUF3631 domain-containing protein [Bifidobacterium amazonense]MCH9276411.1 DUF3631 domain-containing protein [Bifidobacterium amazonense]
MSATKARETMTPQTIENLGVAVPAGPVGAVARTRPGKRGQMPPVSQLKPAEATVSLVDASGGTHTQEVSNASKASKVSSDVGRRVLELLDEHVGASLDDLVVVTLWILHTWTCNSLGTTPRLLISSIIPGAGKTTLLDWIKHLSHNAVMMAAVSSASLLAGLAEAGYTMLVDEADRSLRKDNPLTQDFLAIVNSGYKVGNTRPVNKPTKDGGWEPSVQSTFAPVAFAGNNPDLPDDTEQRCIQLFLYPDDTVAETDWELIEENGEYTRLLGDIERWAGDGQVLKALRNRPAMPECVKARFREIWLPLARVAQTLDDYDDMRGRKTSWLDTVARLAEDNVTQSRIDAAEGLRKSSPSAALLRDVAAIWSRQWEERRFVCSADMCNALALYDPEAWGIGSEYRKITPKRLAGLLKKTGVHAGRNEDNTKRGYRIEALVKPWDSLRIWESLEPQGVKRPKILDTLDALDTLDTSQKSAGDSAEPSETTDEDGPDREPDF